MKTQTSNLQELDKFMGGALQERFSRAISEVAANIFDPNAKPEAARKITVQLIIKPSKSRREASVMTKVAVALAPMNELETTVNIGIDEETGELVMMEQSDIVNGQINLFTGETHENKVAKFPTAKQQS